MEEQFYLVMPLALLASIVVAALVLRRRDVRAHRAGVVTVLALATAASLAWSVHASTVSPESAYFSTFTRVWEFAAGGAARRVRRPASPAASATWRATSSRSRASD